MAYDIVSFTAQIKICRCVVDSLERTQLPQCPVFYFEHRGKQTKPPKGPLNSSHPLPFPQMSSLMGIFTGERWHWATDLITFPWNGPQIQLHSLCHASRSYRKVRRTALKGRMWEGCFAIRSSSGNWNLREVAKSPPKCYHLAFSRPA